MHLFIIYQSLLIYSENPAEIEHNKQNVQPASSINGHLNAEQD